MRKTICLLPLLLLALSGAARADEQANRRDVQAIYAQFGRACLHHDLKAVLAMFSPNVVFLNVEGSPMHYEQVKKFFTSYLKTLGPGSRIDFTIKMVDRKDANHLIALVDERVLEVPPPAKAPARPQTVAIHRHPAQHFATYRDTWVRGAKGWQNTVGVTLSH